MSAAPTAPPPSQGPPKAKAKPMTLGRALLPLVLLLVPLGMDLGARFLEDPWSTWLLLAAAVLAVLILAWVLVRLIIYGHQRWLLHRQRAFQRRQDQYFVAGTKLDTRLRLVNERLKAAGLGEYGLSWFLVMGRSPAEVEALLKNSGLTFPSDMDQGLNLSADQIDRWYLANQAIFIDTSASPPDRQDRHWEVLASRLAARRPREPISGVILVLDVDQLAEDDPEAKERWRQGVLERLRTLQARLKLSFPVYLVVSGMNRVPGFHEFFSDLDQEARSRILGWSAPLSPEQEFDQNLFRRGLGELAASIDKLMLQRLSGSLPPRTADRVYMFNEQFRGVLKALREEVEAVFAPNLYLDPLPFRGFYFCGGLEEGPMVSFLPQASWLARPSSAQQSDWDGFETSTGWFVRDLFKDKILGEQGLVSRPRHVRRRNLIIQTATALLAAAALVLGGWWMMRTVEDTRLLVKSLEPTLETARANLLGGKAEYRPLDVCRLLLRRKALISHIAWWEELVGAGRYSQLRDQIGRIHRACFQELFLRGYLGQVEDALRYWSGEGDFPLFAGALVEYIRWARPQTGRRQDLRIAPFAQFLASSQAEPQEIIEQYRAFLAEGGPSGNLVNPHSLQIIEQALARMDKYLNPALPRQGSVTSWQRQSQWWLELALGLDELARRYRMLLGLRPPASSDDFQQVQATYDIMADRLAAVLKAIDGLGRLLDQGAAQQTSWIGVEKILRQLRHASQGWEPVARRVEKVAQAASLYRRRIVQPLEQNLYLVQLLSHRHSFAWFSQVLSQALPRQASIITDPLYQVGPFIQQLLQALKDYHGAIRQWQSGYQTWVQHIAASERIGKQAEMLRLEEQGMIKAQSRVEEVRQEIKDLLGHQQKPAAPAPAGGVMSRLLKGKKALTKAKQAVVSTRQELLSLFSWSLLDRNLPGWLEAMKRVRLYQTALYWQELEDKFEFGGSLLNEQPWSQIKSDPVFATGDAYALVSPVSEFLDDWVQELPHEFLSFSKPGGKNPPPRELSDFLALNQSIIGFRQKWLPRLRKAAQQFVTCVHDLDLDPARAWAQIWNTAGPGASGRLSVSWGALMALSGFRDAFEAENGQVLDNITGTLVDIENNLIGIFQRAVVQSFNQRWQALLDKYQKLGFDQAFPFNLQGKSEIDRRRLSAFFDELRGLAQAYAILPQEHTTPAPAAGPAKQPAQPAPAQLAAPAQNIRRLLLLGGRQQFVQSCLALEKFLSPRGRRTPLKATVRLKPGSIGSEVHWVRLQLGQGGHYDLNVYGRPAVTIDLQEEAKSVTFQALDMNKNPLASFTATRGDHALLQLPYAWGTTNDPARKVWIVRGQVPSVASPGKMIPFQMEMTFNTSLPELPKWPSHR